MQPVQHRPDLLWRTGEHNKGLFLRARPHPPAAHLTPALIDPAVRDELTRAAERADAIEADGFADSWAFLTRDLFDPDATVSIGVKSRFAIYSGRVGVRM